MTATITTGTKVTYTNRKGNTLAGEVVEVLPAEMAEVYGEYLVIVHFPEVDTEKRMKPADLVILDI